LKIAVENMADRVRNLPSLLYFARASA